MLAREVITVGCTAPAPTPASVQTLTGDYTLPVVVQVLTPMTPEERHDKQGDAMRHRKAVHHSQVAALGPAGSRPSLGEF